MAIDFPTSPTVGQQYSFGGVTYTYTSQGVWSAGVTVPTDPPFASGTATVFWQATSPLGWTKLTTHNDKTLRVTSGAGGGAGGANPFSSVMAQTVTGNTTISGSTMPSHNHTGGSNIGYSGGAYWTGFDTGGLGPLVYAVPSDYSGGGAAHNHPITMNVQYIDLILASKD
jgi:hypothetical protein